MKKILAIILGVISFLAVSAKDKIVYNDSPLPQQSKELIAKHFTSNVNFVKIDNDSNGKVKDYEAVLSNGTQIEFEPSGNLKSIEAGANGVPSALIPQAISSYLNSNYNGQKIAEFSVHKKYIEVELQNGVELKFDLNGKFIGIDK